MTTAMQIAFVSSPSVTVKNELGRRILNIAQNQAQQEQHHIRMVAIHKANARIERENQQLLKSVLNHDSNISSSTPESTGA